MRDLSNSNSTCQKTQNPKDLLVQESSLESMMERGSTVPLEVCIFTGGSAFNSVAGALRDVNGVDVTYIMPTTDNGGSTAEIIKHFGGPAIGDIRSRLLRLASKSTPEQTAVARILSHRINSHGFEAAKEEFRLIVDGIHELWSDEIPGPYKVVVRRYILAFYMEMLKTAGEFDCQNLSIGNAFFTGARLEFNSLDAAIFMYSCIAQIPPNQRVIPVINDAEMKGSSSYTLEAVLADGSVIQGQSSISHPGSPGSGNIVSKSLHVQPALQARIHDVHYINENGNRVRPAAHAAALEALQSCDIIVFAHGSLYTSIIPCLIPDGIRETILRNRSARRVLLLNAWEDRETAKYTAVDYVTSINAVLQPMDTKGTIITDVFAPMNGRVEVDKTKLNDLGIRVTFVESRELTFGSNSFVAYNEVALIDELIRLRPCSYS